MRQIRVGIYSGLQDNLAAAMPIHFKKSEPASKALRRACRGHVGEALDWLHKTQRPAAIHNVRKEIKKVRAILRLMPEKEGDDIQHKAARGLRKAANRLAGPRDARVMLRAFQNLAADGPARFPRIHEALQKHCQREARRFREEDAMAVAERLLRKTKWRVGKLKVEASGWSAVEPGLKRSYTRGRALLQLAGRQPSPENLHDWRKQVKDLWFHLQLLCPDWPAETRALASTLESLGEKLGEEHDLFLLMQFGAEQRVATEADGLNRLIEKRRERLRADALMLGVAAFAAPPAVLCRRLERQWNAWHGGSPR